MDLGMNHKSSRYFCNSHNIYLTASLLSNHLQLYNNHKIRKIESEKPSSDYFNKSILNRIDSIFKVQKQIQQSSINLTQAIMINTTFAISKLDHLVRFYRNILSNPPQNLNMQNTEIFSTFYADESINKALIDYFNQTILAERFNADRKKEIINSKILELFTKRSGNFMCMALFNSENFIVTGGCDGFIRIWETKSNTQFYFLKKHKNIVLSVAIGLDDSILLSGSSDRSVRLWDLKFIKHIHKFEGHLFPVSSVLISKSNEIGVSGSWDQTIKIWNLQKKEVKFTFSVFNLINAICLFDEDKMLAVAGNGGVMFWTLRSKSKMSLAHKKTSVIAFSKDEHHFIIGDFEGFIQIWVSKTQKIIFEDRKHSQQINSIAFSHHSLTFATGSNDKKVLIWDFTSKKTIHSLSYNSEIKSLVYFKDSETLSICTLLREVYYFKLKHNLNEKKINPKQLEYCNITLSSDLAFIAYGNIKILLFDVEKSTKISKINYLEPYCTVLKFTKNNKYLGRGNDSGEILIFKLPSLVQVYKLNLGKSSVKCLAFSANTKLVASAYKEGTMFVWSIENKNVVYKEKNLIVNSLVFCFNSEKLIYSINGGIIILDKYYVKKAILKLENYAQFIFLGKDDKTILVLDTCSSLSEIDTLTGKILFDNKRKSDVKKMVVKDQKLHLFLLWEGINLS